MKLSTGSKFIAKLLGKDGGGYFDKLYEEEWGRDYWKARWSLWYFLAEMKAGDRVVVPGFANQGSFSVYEIEEDSPMLMREVHAAGLKTWTGEPVTLTDGLLSCKGEQVGLGFVRRVRQIERDLPRSSFADAALTSRMKVRLTTANISDLNESVTRAIAAYRSNRPINLHNILLEEHTQATLNAICRDLNPDKFEKLIAWYFQKIGAKAEIPAKNESGKDGDVDIVATFEPLKTIIYVQAKFHNGRTDEWAVKQIVDYRNKKNAILNEDSAMDDGYSRSAWVVSTAPEFSERCNALAKENKILLLNGKDFVRLLLNVGIGGLDLAF